MSIYLTHKGTSDKGRPGLELFFSRAVAFGGLFLFAEFLFLAQRPMPVWKWFLSWILRFILLILFNYHLIIGLAFKRLSYEIKDNSLIIKSFPFNRKILLQDITDIKAINHPLEIKKGAILAYAKESPQVIHFVGQYGMFRVSEIGTVFLYTTLSSYHHPEGLILIKTVSGKIFGVSPENPEDFIKELQEKIKRFKGESS
jgi:hypothetical protein